MSANDYYQMNNQPQGGQQGGYVNNQTQGYNNQQQGYNQQQQGYQAGQYNNNQQAQYAPPQGAPPQQYNQPPPQYGQGFHPPTYDPQGEKQEFEQTFKVDKPKWNDLWAGILFIAVVLGFVGISVVALRGYSSRKSNVSFGVNARTGYLFILVIVAALVVSYAYVWLARLFPKVFIWVSGILNIIFGFALAFFLLAKKSYAAGIISLIFAVLTVVFFISWIPRIPFSAFMLKTSIKVSKNYGHCYIVSLIGGIVACAFSAYYVVTVAAVHEYWQNSSGTQGGIIFFLTFAMYWISEWLKGTIATTIAGVYGSWYFCSHNFPKNATRGAFKRSITYSFGSISLGSLITAIISFLRQLAQSAQQAEGQDGNIVGYVLFCVLSCLIGLLEWAVEFVNRYAFITIALYGKSYFQAAKSTWHLIKDRGFDALINLCLLGPVFSMGSVFVGFVCALLAFIYTLSIQAGYSAYSGNLTFGIVAISFLIGMQVCSIMVTPISVGVDTIFTAAAWDPQVLQRDHPDLYAQMLAVYPPLAQAIHV